MDKTVLTLPKARIGGHKNQEPQWCSNPKQDGSYWIWYRPNKNKAFKMLTCLIIRRTVYLARPLGKYDDLRKGRANYKKVNFYSDLGCMYYGPLEAPLLSKEMKENHNNVKDLTG